MNPPPAAQRCFLHFALFLCLSVIASAQVNVLTYHNDLSRTGQNLNETILTPANVIPSKFGQLFQYPVDGYIYAQPLYLSGITIPGQGVHNVVIACTEHNSVYAFDADSNTGTNAGVLWQVNLGPSAATPNNDFGNRYGAYHDINPEVGITGTPAIDLTNGVIYIDAFTHEGTSYYHRIHALSIYDGTEKLGGPLLVSATYPGTGVGSTANVHNFITNVCLQRPALTFVNGKLYIAYSGYADTNPYHGWVLGFNTSPTLSLATGNVWMTTPNSTTAQYGANAGEGGIWMGGDGLCVDPNNTSMLFFETGNGTYGNATGGTTSPTEFGDSVMRLSTTSGLAVSDWFTPYNQLNLQNGDTDLGSGGALLFPNGVGSTAHPHLMLAAGKQGSIYLIDRDTMTSDGLHYNSAGSPDKVVQVLSAIGAAFSTPAYFNGKFYYGAQGDVMKAFTISNGVMAGPTTKGTRSFSHPGATPSISANGTTNGIVWVTAMGTPAVLCAYDANTVATEIYASDAAGTRDQLPAGVKFTLPTVANGKVYVGTQTALAIFGLLPVASSPPAAPTALTALPASAIQINLTWTDNSTNELGFEIWRSTDGTTYTNINTSPAGSTSYSDASLAVNTTYYYKVRAINTAGNSAYTNVAGATTLNNQANAGLVARWNLDDGSGTVAADSIGGDNGVVSGETTWVGGVIGGALNFHGGGMATARVSIPDEAAIDFTASQSFTVTTWVNPANTAGKYSEVISKSWGTSPGYEIGIDPNSNWIFRGPTSDVTGTPVTTGWHHIAAVQNAAAGTRTLYVDGIATATGVAQAANGTGELVFAEADSVNERFSGIIDDVRIYNRALSAPEVQTLAQTTWSDSDIGAVGAAGSATIYNGLFTINGAGADIWGNADAFHFVYQQVSGDCQITARVASVQNTNAWAKVGVMIRESLAAGSTYADAFVTPGNGAGFQYRQTTGGTCGSITGATTTAPYWVRLVRTGNVITAYQSGNGTTWAQIGSETYTMGTNVYIGLCDTSHSDPTICTGTIDNVSVNTEGNLAFSNALYTVSEQGGTATVTVSRTGGTMDAVSVKYGTGTGGSAVAGTNYTTTSGTLTWSDGDGSSKSFSVPILDSHVAGPNLSINLALNTPGGGATLGTLSTATLTILEDSWDTWLYNNYGANANNASVAGPLATPDGDGISNLTKYAMAINPAVSAAGELPVISVVNGYAQIVFQRSIAVGDVTYVVEGTNTLGGTWAPLATYTPGGGWVANELGTKVSEGATLGIIPFQYVPVTVTDPTPIGGSASRFLRVKVTH